MVRTYRVAGGLALVLGLAALGGCGGGGHGRYQTGVTGIVTNTEGKPVTGAYVEASGGAHAISLANGTFVLRDVSEGYRRITASVRINGYMYSGETVVDVASQMSSTVNIMVSDERYQGGIEGRVIGPEGGGLRRAKVFVGGPYASTMAVTDDDGHYEVDRLDSGYTYTVSASLAGYLNHTQTEVSVSAGQFRTVSFALAYGSTQGLIPAPTGLEAQAWTVPDRPTRSAGASGGPYKWLQAIYRKRRGLPANPRTSDVAAVQSGRSTPYGSVVEVDLFWLYPDPAPTDLLGYAIKRGTSAGGSMPVVAVLRDPLAVAFFDVSDVLTPDAVYYYTVHSLDTIRFPDNGDVGPASAVVSAQPLEPEHLLSPALGATVGTAPVLRWSAVNGAATYQILMWDRFPTLTDPADPNSAHLVWPADLNNPGSSLVQAPATQQTYGGPALQPGKTYYWMVVATDQGAYSVSASEIFNFTPSID